MDSRDDSSNNNVDDTLSLIREAISREQWSKVISLTRGMEKYKEINLYALICMERFKQALKQHKGTINYDYAYCLYREEKYLKCIEILHKLKKEDKINILLAQCFYHLSKYEESANLYKPLIKSDDRAHVNYLACLAHLSSNENEKGSNDFIINDNNNDNNYEIVFNQALCKMNRGMDATIDISKAIKIGKSQKEEACPSRREFDIMNACMALNYQLLNNLKDANDIYQKLLSDSETDELVRIISTFNRSILPINKNNHVDDNNDSKKKKKKKKKKRNDKDKELKTKKGKIKIKTQPDLRALQEILKKSKKLSPLQNKTIQFNLKLNKL